MALNDVTFVKGQGGLGRPLTGEDHISGLVFYSDTLPSNYGVDPVKTIFSLEEAEALDIVGDYSNETKASSTITITTGAGLGGGSIQVTVDGVLLGIAQFADTTSADDVAAGLRSAINAGTSVHGYTASGTTTAVTITAVPGKGANIHSVTPDVSLSGGIVHSTLNAFAGGVNDPYIVLWYHIKEFFRVQPKGILYLGIYDVPASWNYEEIKTLQSISGGVIRQVAVYTTENFTTAQVTALHTRAEELSAVEKKPLSVLFGANISGVALTALPDLSESTGSYVSVVIGQDGNEMGNELYSYTGKSITCLGAVLGAVSRSKVSENIGWVKNFNLAENELDVIAFAEGTEYREVSESQLSQLNDKHYIFLRKHIGITGSYFNDSHTAVSETSDYATIENNRTIDKAIRNIRAFLVPELNGPLFVDPVSGSLSEDTVAYFQNLASRPLEQMQRDQELSGFQVIINPAQDVLETSKLTIVVKLVPVGVARQIQVNIGFTVNIS